MKLKIGIACDAIPPAIDGIANTVHNYGKIINDEHGECVVMTPRNPAHKKMSYPYDIFEYNSWIYPPMYKEGYRIGWPFKQYIREEARALNCDVYHSHVPLASSYLIELALQEQDIPYVLTYHTKYDIEIKKRIPFKPLRDYARNFILKRINSADEVWVTSEGTVQSLRAMGYTGDYILMPNGVDMEKGRADEDKIDAFCKANGIHRDVPVLLFVGRMMWYKNIRLILDACKKLKENKTPFQMVLAGAGPDYRSIFRYAKKKGLLDCVTFTGQIKDRDDLKSLYSAADLFIFPSTFDTNGLVVREAAACQCPSILVKGSCAAEGIKDNETGFLIDENAQSLYEKILMCLENKELSKRVGVNAQEKIYISWKDAVAKAYKRYEEIYEKHQRAKKETEKVN